MPDKGQIPKGDSMKLEELIEKHRPAPGHEDEPASSQLEHLNLNGLLAAAIDLQIRKDGGTAVPLNAGLTITKQTAWEVLSEAQRGGLRLKRPSIAKAARRN